MTKFVTKPKTRNKGLVSTLSRMPVKKNIVEGTALVKETHDAVNISGTKAFKQADFYKLLSILNTSKLEPTFYKTDSQVAKDLQNVLDICATESPYFTAQCIVYSRCIGEGMRSINHLAAALLAPYISGQPWAKHFYSVWNKKANKGGTIFRPDDIAEILAIYNILNNNNSNPTNAMKNGFAYALQNMDTYSLVKYKSNLIDAINIAHPDPKESKAVVEVETNVLVEKLTELATSTVKRNKSFYSNKLKAIDKRKAITSMSAIEAIILNIPVKADTWETNQSEAGQLVKAAKDAGKLTEAEAAKVLVQAKSENWATMLEDGKLGILAAIRNIRNILSNKPSTITITRLCDLFSNGEKIKQGKILPFQIDVAIEIVKTEFSGTYANSIIKALETGYYEAIPNLAKVLPGKTLVMIDTSVSMNAKIVDPNKRGSLASSCLQKSILVAATFAHALKADVVEFNNTARYLNIDTNKSIQDISLDIFRMKTSGGTDISKAFELIRNKKAKYDRIILLSDNEANRGCTQTSYGKYVTEVCSPYIYSIDLQAYGTDILRGPKVKHFFGYGLSMFDDIVGMEFNPDYHFEKVKSVNICFA